MGQLVKEENNLLLSQGLSSKIIATSNEQVLYNDGELSDIPFHTVPSGAETFPDTRGNNTGGWIYVSGKDSAEGGVGAITFNADGEVLNYEMIYEGTKAIGNGGKTPWDSYVTGERPTNVFDGKALQIDPFGQRNASKINMTQSGGAYLGFAYDNRNTSKPYFFLTEDYNFGCVRRFTPNATSMNSTDLWMQLDGGGTTDYLRLQPHAAVSGKGTFNWTSNIMLARQSAQLVYPESSGIAVHGKTLSFAIQGQQKLFQLDLDTGGYKVTSTNTGLFDGEPNTVRYVEGKDGTALLYMTENGGERAGIHALDGQGRLFTVLEGFYEPWTSGFAISPDGNHMYVSFQKDGLVFDITRDDGLSFFDAMTFDSMVEVESLNFNN